VREKLDKFSTFGRIACSVLIHRPERRRNEPTGTAAGV
jgi:hypothetical protein